MNVTSLYPAASEPLPGDLEGACRALEKEFAHLVFHKMREAMVPKASPGSSGYARQTAESMLDAQWAELASRGEGLGLWRAMYRQLEAEAVKSGPLGVDQRIRWRAQRTEKRSDTEGSARTPGPRVGRARPREAATPHPGASGLPEPKGLPGSRALLTDREGM
jgi:Rod binding domain-containing protein